MKNKEIWKIPLACAIFIGIIALVLALRTGAGPVVITGGVFVDRLNYSNSDATPDKININTANAVLLSRLPGIGTKMAERIIAYRNENGPYSKIEDIMNVSGIGEKRFEELAGYISVSDE